jgi:hypothetical protein
MYEAANVTSRPLDGVYCGTYDGTEASYNEEGSP